MSNIYVLSANDTPFYVGHSRDVQDRLIGHQLQAIRDYRTDKDKFIYNVIASGSTVTAEKLFTSPFFTTNDETFMMYLFNDVLGCEMLNTSLGEGVQPLDRLKKLPGISRECEEVARLLCEAREVELPKVKMLEPKAGVANTVTVNNKTTLMVIEVVDIKYVNNKYGGENTPIIKYKWLNTNRTYNANKVHSEPYTDSLRHCHDMVVGNKYAIWTKKVQAPDNAQSMIWSWEHHVPFDMEWRVKRMVERLQRIDMVWNVKTELRPYLSNMRLETYRILSDINNWSFWK